ncbi:MAG: hypothetical protein KAI17_19750 [Thiotrichaceae bacterium]|nr:hypothetical protein [Thiotrichaceae bacterium]
MNQVIQLSLVNFDPIFPKKHRPSPQPQEKMTRELIQLPLFEIQFSLFGGVEFLPYCFMNNEEDENTIKDL